MVVAGAPPPSKVIERVREELGWEFIQIYGLTETSPLLTVNRAPAECDDLEPPRAGPAALAGRRPRHRRADRRRRARARSCARSNNVFEGYWEQPDETAKAIVDGWFHTGDGGYLDGPYLVISDRKKDVIISGGENVSSIEVEDCLYQHPAVAEVRGDRRSRREVGRDDQGARRAASRARTAERARPHRLLPRAGSPTSSARRRSSSARAPCRTATGKLQKFKLRAPYWEGRERRVN